MAQRRIKRECILIEALRPHPIRPTIFEPFVVTELGGTSEVEIQMTEFKVILGNIGAIGTRTHRLRLVWRGDKALLKPYPMQQEDRTEWAGVGIACAVLWHYTGLRVWDSGERGQGFDYWVGGETKEQGIEISGSISEDVQELRKRHREKREQLFASYKVGGYVVIVGLARREIIFSYHAPEETA